MENDFLKRENICALCNNPNSLVGHKNSIDELSWRCMNVKCKNYKKYASIRENSFFHGFNLQLKDVLRVVIKYSYFQQSYSIKNSLDISKSSVDRILKKLINNIPDANYEKQKLGGLGFIVQVDETMLNFKCTSHRGRSPNNRTDALCIIEFKNKITKCFATVINNKEAKKIIPIICSQVLPGSVIHIDEHKAILLYLRMDLYMLQCAISIIL